MYSPEFIIDTSSFIYHFQRLLKDSSDVLYTALDQRAFFKAVTIVVPSSWRDSQCQTIIRPPNKDGDTHYRNANSIQVTEKHPIYGQEIFTQQSGGCGKPGDLIKLPYTLLNWGKYFTIVFVDLLALC